MLKTMRSNIKKLHWVLWIVILSFILWGVGSIGQLGGVPQDVIKSVEGVHISFRDYEFAYRRMVSFYAQMYGDQFSPEMIEQMQIKQSALSSVVEETEKAVLAGKLGLAVSEDELRDAIMKIPELQDEDGNFIGRDIYLQILRMNNLSVSEFEEGLRKSLLTEKLNDYFSQTLIPSRSDAYQKFLFDNTTREFEYITVMSSNVMDMVEYTETEIEEFFLENMIRYQTEEERSIIYLVFDPLQYEQDIVNERDLLMEYYMSHREEFVQEEQVKASHILLPIDQDSPENMAEVYAKAYELKKELEEGADFGLLARLYSEDPGSKEKSGDLGFFGRGQMVPPFEEAAFSMTVGEISDPVESQFGLHIIKVTDRKPETVMPFEDVKARIDARLRRIKADRIAQNASEEFVRDISAREEMINKAEASGIELKVTEPFGNRGAIPDIGFSRELVEAVFLAGPDMVNPPVKVRNAYYVFSIEEILEPRIPELGEEGVIERVSADYRVEKAGDIARETAESIKQLLEEGVLFNDLAVLFPEAGIEKKETGKITIQGNVFGIQDRDKVIELFSMEEGMVYGPVPNQDMSQWTLYTLMRENLPDHEDFENQLDDINESLKMARGFQVYRSWFEHARKGLKVKTNNQLLRYIMEN